MRLSELQRDVLQILREEAYSEPQLEERLSQLFHWNRVGFANAIVRMEIRSGQEICDLKYIDWLRERTVEFVIWALEQNSHKDVDPDEWVYMGPYVADNEERVLEIQNAMVISDFAKLTNEDFKAGDNLPMRERMLKALLSFPHLFKTWIWTSKRFKSKTG